MLKKRYLFLIMIVCLFAVSTVSAAEISNETNVMVDDYDSSLMVESVDKNVLTDSYGTFKELENEINAVGEGGTLNLTKNYKYDFNSDDVIKISKSLTVNGNNHIIDGNNQSQIFSVVVPNVFINNITFMNSNGGAINVDYWDDVVITDCKFINNVANQGGAIYSLAYVILNNCEFINNYATFMHGGAIYAESSMNINNCKFNSNSALAYGGAIYSEYGTLRLNNSDFINNIGSCGGAIYSENNGQLVNNCTFNSNSASNDGGAIFVHGDSYNNITYCEFNSNSAPNGGAILLKGAGASYVECIIKDTDFINNYGDIGSSIYILEAYSTGVEAQILDSYFYNTKNKEFIYSKDSVGRLFLKNNTMVSPNSYKIYTKFGPDSIYSKKYLILENETCYVNKPFTIAFTDDNGNKIRLDEDIPITLTDFNNDYSFEIYAKCDYESGCYNASCNQVGVYKLSLDPEFSSNVTIVPEILEVYSIVNISAPEVVKYFGGSERFVVTLTDGNDNPLPDKTISIILNGVPYTRTTDSYGMASMAINLNSGVYDVIVECNDINVTSKITVLSTIEGNDIVKMYKNNTQYYATFLDTEGNYLAKNTFVQFNLNGTFYFLEIMDKGIAKLDINEQPGEYILTASNPVTGEYVVNRIIVLPNIVENHDLIKYYNESDRFNVRVLDSTGNPASGEKVKFTILYNVYEATSNSNGYAFLDAVLQPETYTVTTSYGGLEVLNTIVILPTLVDRDMKVSSSDIYVGENEVIKVVLPKDATGKVSTNINGKEYSVNVNNGAANIIVSGLSYGNYAIDVIYSGDSHYNSVKNQTSFFVDKAVDLSAPDVTKYYGGPERFIVTLRDLDGNPIKNAVVKITINGRTSERVTDDNGIASMAINLNSGKYDVTTEYGGTKAYSTVTVRDTVIANDFTKIFRNGTQYYGTFVDSQGNLIKNTDIQININGVFYTRTTNDQGVARMNINLNPGTFILTATNPLSGEQHTTKITVLPSIVENHDLTKYYKNASKYTLRIIGDNGKPVGEGVEVKLNINGIFYTRTTNASGYINMNINLPPETYTVTAEYNGLRASNKIIVLSVLKTKDLSMKYHDGSKFEAKVLDGQGKPYAGQTVTFNINGVFYPKTTGADGIARLTINLPAGDYIITSTFNGLNAANKVKVADSQSYDKEKVKNQILNHISPDYPDDVNWNEIFNSLEIRDGNYIFSVWDTGFIFDQNSNMINTIPDYKPLKYSFDNLPPSNDPNPEVNRIQLDKYHVKQFYSDDYWSIVDLRTGKRHGGFGY